MKEKEKDHLHNLVIRLLEGGHVWFNQHMIKAVHVSDEETPCFVCEMDSICDNPMCNLCCELDEYGKGQYHLKLC